MTETRCGDCPHFEKPLNGSLVDSCRRWLLRKFPEEKCGCDPCRYCRHYSEFEDRSTGYLDTGCSAEEEFPIYDGVKPCPYFRPLLASDGLFDQLAEEGEMRYWLDRGLDTDEDWR